MEVPIIYEDADMLAIAKPAGLLVHGYVGSHEETLSEWLLLKYPELAEVGEKEEGIARPGIVHRLDRDTSGVLVVAKTPTAHAALKKQFQERDIHKVYRAIVYGVVEKDAGIIEAPIGRVGPGNLLRTAVRPVGKLRDAVTEYKVLERFPGYTYLELHPRTGRTHQIRVHLKSIGHPVVCDTLYAPRRVCLPEIGRLALHALSLDITAPDGTPLHLETPLPEDFERVLAKLRSLC